MTEPRFRSREEYQAWKAAQSNPSAAAPAETPRDRPPAAGSGPLIFENPANGYQEEVSLPWLWALLFGGFYFAVKGIWTHASVGLGLAFLTFGISWVVYPFFASTIVRRHYLRKGWREVH